MNKFLTRLGAALLAAGCLTMSAVNARSEVVALVCQRSNNDNVSVWVDDDANAVTLRSKGVAPITFPAKITAMTIVWFDNDPACRCDHVIDRVTGHMTGTCRVSNCDVLPAQCEKTNAPMPATKF